MSTEGKMDWRDYLTAIERDKILQYEATRLAYQCMQKERALIRNRARLRMLKSKNITSNSSCTLSQK